MCLLYLCLFSFSLIFLRQEYFLDRGAARTRLKVRFGSDFRFSRGPKIRRHRPVSGVSDRWSQHRRSAAFGGLPSLPPGVHPGNQNGIQNLTFEIIFRHQILASFLACLFSGIFSILVALWLPLGPFWAFWKHFGLHFGSLLAHFYLILASFFPTSFLHSFFMDFWEISGTPAHVKKTF